MAQSFYMQAKKENYWFMFRLLLVLNIALITAIILIRPGKSTPVKTQETCTTAKKINADVLNAITVRLM